MRGVASNEIGKISWVWIVKGLVNHMNKFELYPSGKKETMEVFKQRSNIMTFFLGRKSWQQSVRKIGEGQIQRQGDQWEMFAIMLARKIQGSGNE